MEWAATDPERWRLFHQRRSRGWIREVAFESQTEPPPSPFSHAPVHVPQLAYIKHVITRTNTYTNVSYVDDPTIFAWEVMNE